MKKIYLFLIILLLIIPNIAIAGEVKNDLAEKIKKISPNEKIPVIVRFHKKPLSADINNIKSEGVNIKHQYKIIDAVAVNIPAKLAEKIAQKNFVKQVEPDYEVKLVLDSSSKQIQADKTWQSGITGKGIDIAVLDTGIHDEHPDLMVARSIDLTGEGSDDLNGHGTHVAGIIASQDYLYHGIANDSSLLNVKVLNKYGSGYGSDIIKGIEWAVDNGAEIISMSLGAEVTPCDGTDAISQSVDNAVIKGAVVVVAAGNQGPDSGTITSPGCSKQAITVGAVDDFDKIASFSSRGPTGDGRAKPDIVAPGVGITSTWIDNSFKSLSGTSMATPHVAGVIALMLEKDPALNSSGVKEKLKSSATNLGLDQNSQGYGRINAPPPAPIESSSNYSGTVPISVKGKPYVIINKFSSDKDVAKPGENFTLTLKVGNIGDKSLDGVNAMLTMPSGLTTDSLKKSIGSISSGKEVTSTWKANAVKEGSYDIKIDVTSSNDGSTTAKASIGVFSYSSANKTQNQTTNVTPITTPPIEDKKNASQNMTYNVPPGIAKKNLTLPPGLAKKIGSLFFDAKNIFERLNPLFLFKAKTIEKPKQYVKKAQPKSVESLTKIYEPVPERAQPAIKKPTDKYPPKIEPLKKAMPPQKGKPVQTPQQSIAKEKPLPEKVQQTVQTPEKPTQQAKEEIKDSATAESKINIEASASVNASIKNKSKDKSLPSQASAVAKAKAKIK